MKMDGVLKLYFGESNLPTPAYIKEAAATALHDGYTYYTETPACRVCGRTWPNTTAGCKG